MNLVAQSCCELQAFQPLARSLNIGLRPLDPASIRGKKVKHGFEGQPTSVQVEILQTDKLAEDPLVFHPVVRVSFVDARTGKHLRKEDVDVPAVSYYEHSSLIKVSKGTSDKVQNGKGTGGHPKQPQRSTMRKPIKCKRVPTQITQPCESDQGRVHVVAPSWRKQAPLVFNIPLDLILNPYVLIFFELLDFGPTIPYKILSKGKGFYCIAWAFLRVMSSQGVPNVCVANSDRSPSAGMDHANGNNSTTLFSETSSSSSLRQIRLQLYKYASPGSLNQSYLDQARNGEYGPIPTVFESYRALKRIRYPSTLYVRISGILQRNETVTSSRALFSTERESREGTGSGWRMDLNGRSPKV